MKLYIMAGRSGNTGEGHYYLLTEDGECLASHLCSNSGYAKSDLITGRPERIKEYTERFGDYEVLWVGDDDLTEIELLKRNKDWFNKKED